MSIVIESAYVANHFFTPLLYIIFIEIECFEEIVRHFIFSSYIVPTCLGMHFVLHVSIYVSLVFILLSIHVLIFLYHGMCGHWGRDVSSLLP